MPDTLQNSGAFKASILAIIAQVPLLAGFISWWEQVQRRPVITILIGVLYEVSILGIAFGRKVWAKLEDRAVEGVADRILAGVKGIAPGFRRRYKKHVISEHGIFNVRGLGLINTYTLALDHVYVDLRVDPSNPQKFNIDPIAQRELTGNQPIWNFLRLNKSRVSEATALAVIGPPGSGKTTLLQHVALTFAYNRQQRYHISAYTPILLFLRDHIRSITQETPPTLGKLVDTYFSNDSLFPTLSPPSNWFEKQLKSGKCVALLDGLDEVADIEQRRLVSAWVDNQIKNYPRSHFVLTARPQGYRDTPLLRAHVLAVQPFDNEQVHRFIKNWYLANEIVSSGGKTDTGVRQRASREADDLVQRLRSLPALSALTVNPLLLTMIAMVHRYHGALPGTRVELYAEICEVLLGRWRHARGVQDTFKASQKLVVLRPLAAHMMEHKIREVSGEEAMAVIETPLEQVGISGEIAKGFLVNLQASSGLLLEREAGWWSFAHLTFQEYLAAAHWIDQKYENLDWRRYVDDSWWHETLRLYAAQGDATPIVRICLEVDSMLSLTLAADCLNEFLRIESSVRHAVEERVIKALKSTDPARRRLAAEVQLTRRLKSLQRMDANREIDLQYLTWSEYQLFLDDMRTQGKYYQPDHWSDFSFPIDDAQKPVAGVRAEDAIAFCDWLTHRQGGNARFRLPEFKEANQYPAIDVDLSTWCMAQDSYKLVGASNAFNQKVRQRLPDIVSNSRVPVPSSFDQDIFSDLSLVCKESLFRQHEQAVNRTAVINKLTQAVTSALKRKDDSLFNSAIKNARILSKRLVVFHDWDISLSFERNLDRVISVNSYSSGESINAAFEAALELAEKTHKDFYPVVSAINSKNLLIAVQLLRDMEDEADFVKSNLAILLKDLIFISISEPLLSARKNQRYMLAHRLEPYCINPKIDEGKLGREGQREIPHEAYINAYWWLQITIAREESKLPSWEGIRLVREQ
jgi:hypothetical protein